MPYPTRDSLVILDADGTLIDAFGAMDIAFAAHGMKLGDLARFQKRHKLFKYFGGAREFPKNLTLQLRSGSRKRLLETLTSVYRESARLYPGIPDLLHDLLAIPHLRVALVTRNVCNDSLATLRSLFHRHDVEFDRFAMVHHLQLREDKADFFHLTRTHLGINPARTLVCGDEHRDYEASLKCGMRPWIAAYGFEDFERLTRKFAVPEPVICRDSYELCARLRHSL